MDFPPNHDPQQQFPTSEHAAEKDVPRCQYVSPSPWGPTQCVLPNGHEGRHAYSPSESVTPPEVTR